MEDTANDLRPGEAWTLRKAVTALAISPQNETLTRVGRMAYNVMIYLSQQESPDADGWWCAPVSSIVRGFGSSTRDSARVIEYIRRMSVTSVQWYPLAASDLATAPQQALGFDEPTSSAQAPAVEPTDPLDGTRVFTLLSEARFYRRSGEAWVQWYFAPSIREMLIEPVRWAQIDLQELAALSRYASVVLYEICSRYKNSAGGLTNRASPEWWVSALRTDPKEATREWRKFKNETVKPALAEINQRTLLDVQVIEFKRGRAVTEVQFQVRKRQTFEVPAPPDLELIERAKGLGIKERDLDTLVDEHGEHRIERALDALEARMRLQLKERVHQPLNYLKRILRSDTNTEPLFEEPSPPSTTKPTTAGPVQQLVSPEHEVRLDRIKLINEEIDALDPAELEVYVVKAKELMSRSNAATPAMQKRFASKQYGSPMVRQFIRAAYAESKYGQGWLNA